MASVEYTVILEPGECSGCHVYVPALKGCHSYGATVEGALADIREAIELYLEDLRADGEPVPVETDMVRKVEVAA